MRKLLVAGLCIFIAVCARETTSPSAQPRAESPTTDPFAEAKQWQSRHQELVRGKTLRCTFDPGVHTDWKGGTVASKWATFGKVDFTFDSIDHQRGRARLIANAGAADVNVFA